MQRQLFVPAQLAGTKTPISICFLGMSNQLSEYGTQRSPVFHHLRSQSRLSSKTAHFLDPLPLYCKGEITAMINPHGFGFFDVYLVVFFCQPPPSDRLSYLACAFCYLLVTLCHRHSLDPLAVSKSSIGCHVSSQVAVMTESRTNKSDDSSIPA